MDVRKLSVDQDILYKYITKANEGDILFNTRDKFHPCIVLFII